MIHIRRFACLVLLSLPFAGFGAQPSGVSLHVMETDPATRTELHYDETFYLRIAYSSDRPVRIFARPFFRGEPAIAGNGPTTHPAQLLPAGSGETLGWFAYRGYANVDEVRIRMVAEGAREPLTMLSWPVTLYWDDARTSARRTSPAWVTDLGRAQQQAVSAPSPTSDEDLWLGELIIMAVFALIVLAVGWPAWGWAKWREKWKLAAGVPLAILALWILVLVMSWIADPTAHNLWPFELLMWAIGTFIYMSVVAIARRVSLMRA